MEWVALFFALWVLTAIFDAIAVPKSRRDAYIASFDWYAAVAVACAHFIWVVSVAHCLCSDYEPAFARSLRIAGAVLFFSGRILASLAMRANPFFTARLQYVRPEYRVTGGVYYLRHPGNLGHLCVALGIWLLLASTWAYIPFIVYVVLLAYRIGAEEQLLNS